MKKQKKKGGGSGKLHINVQGDSLMMRVNSKSSLKDSTLPIT